MTALTEPLDRIAQSHIEGRVERVRPAPLEKFTWRTGYLRSSGTPLCVHCNAPYNKGAGFYPHTTDCPCNRSGGLK